jgi:hypothetical protein
MLFCRWHELEKQAMPAVADRPFLAAVRDNHKAAKIQKLTWYSIPVRLRGRIPWEFIVNTHQTYK